MPEAKKHKIVLYNPEAVFYTMPLALIAIASYLDPKRFEVKIIDARLEKQALRKVLKECQDALCFGCTVLTGAPIRDAMAVTQRVKQLLPQLPAVWGGWHASLFPEQCLAETSADIAVRGQGEITFAELLETFIHKESPAAVKGISWKQNGRVHSNPERSFSDINAFPPMNYDLIDVPKYEKLSGRKQLDYIASQGCRFRCTFCADPFVYKRGWFGYSAARLGEELEKLWSTYRFEHVHFQDETFFTLGHRVKDISEEFLRRRFRFTWFATMRADQGARLPDEVFASCKRSGLERVMIGIESGSQRMIDWMKKDIRLSQVFECAEKCLKHGIAINFSAIIGFPGETEEDMNETLRVTRELRKMSPEFRMSIFYFKPYPGNEIYEQIVKEGHSLPKSIQDWADFDFVMKESPWIGKEKFAEIENFKFYQRLAWSKPSLSKKPIQKLAVWRCENASYALPLEKLLYERLFPGPRMS